MGPSPALTFTSRPDRGCQSIHGCGPLTLCAIKRGGGGGTYDKVHCDQTPTQILLLIRSLRRNNGGKPPHRVVHTAAAPELPLCTGSGAILLHQADDLWICYYFTVKYL
jgi:hypothetical protein